MRTFDFKCPRLTEAQVNSSGVVVDIAPQIYVNCGAWQGGRSDFVLVCESDILLCSWGNFVGEANGEGTGVALQAGAGSQEVKPPKVGYALDSHSWPGPALRDRLPEKIKKFLDSVPVAAAPKSRFFPLAHYRAPLGMKFTDNMLVFIGDCHIHLFEGWLCDNFVRPEFVGPDADKPDQPIDAKKLGEEKLRDGWFHLHERNGYYRRRAGLIDELRSFVAHAGSPPLGADSIVQIGDLYEVWEVQGLYELAFEAILDMARVRPGCLRRPFPSTLLVENGKRYDGLLQDHASELRALWEGQLARDMSDPESTWAAVHIARPDDYARWALPLYFGLTKSAGEAVNESEWARVWGRGVPPREVMAVIYYYYRDTLQDHAAADSSGSRDVVQVRQALDKHPNWNESLDFVDCSAVADAIKSHYGGSWGTFHHIEGNHDTSSANEYLKKRYKDGMSRNDARSDDLVSHVGAKWVRQDDPKAELPAEYSTLAGPRNARCVRPATAQVCYEHGHAFDEFNNNKEYFATGSRLYGGLTDAGYHKTRDWVLNELQDSGALLRFGDKHIATPNLIEYSLARAAKILDEHPGIRLVVMGHTHQATIMDDSEQRRSEAEFKREVSRQKRDRAGRF